MLIIDKPFGITSFDVVARVRRLCRERRVGHAGTLDPLATGVLPVCIGSATRLIEYLADAHKEYRATVHLGAVSPTYDAEGPITQQAGPGEVPEAAALEAALVGFRGPQQQLPPIYSAVQQGGKRLYELARRGVEVERTPRPVTIYRLELLEYAPPSLSLLVECSKGTYIRSLAHDLGEALGCGAYLSGLVRTRHGPFRIEDAMSLADLEVAGDCDRALLPADTLVADWPRLDVDADAARRLAQGQPLAHPPPASGDPPRLRVYGPGGIFLALVYWEDQKARWHPTKVFANSEF
ncbi:MAG: tRNA pseudouridine(55) synthase TruB [Candidatus Dormibacteraeota bacterium]|nr:tRNA pseudouridine(55) synthase TruB [Candidatus Dormibacteraeota bacterium]